MDVGNIFKSLFRIYKTTKLPMQHHKSLHTNTTKIQQYALTFPLFPFFLFWSFFFFFFFFFFFCKLL